MSDLADEQMEQLRDEGITAESIEDAWERTGYDDDLQCDHCDQPASYVNPELARVFEICRDDGWNAALCLEHYREWLIAQRFGHLVEGGEPAA